MSECSPNNSSQEVFRTSRFSLCWSLMAIIGFWVGLLGVLYYVGNAFEFPVFHFRMTFFAILAFFAWFCFYSIVSEFRYRVTVAGGEVSVREFFRTRRFRLDEVTVINWDRLSKGFEVRFSKGSWTVDGGLYSHRDFNRLAYLFRTGVPEERQNHWPEFCQLYTPMPGTTLKTWMELGGLILLGVAIPAFFSMWLPDYKVLWFIAGAMIWFLGFVFIGKHLIQDFLQQRKINKQFATTGNLFPEPIFGRLNKSV